MLSDVTWQRNISARRFAAIGLLVGALLGGCGGGDDDADSGGKPPEGSIKGTGYSYVPPDGWRDAIEFFEGSAIKIDTAYAEPDPEKGFANNINVIQESPQGVDADHLDDYIDEFRDQAGTQATDEGLTETEKIELDGEPARTWDLEARRPEEPRVRMRQVVAIRDDDLYTITWSARSDAFEDSTAELERLLDSWRWSR